MQQNNKQMKTTTTIHPLKLNFEIPVTQTLKLPRFVKIFIIEGEKLHLIDTGVTSAFETTKNFITKFRESLEQVSKGKIEIIILSENNYF